MFIVSKRYTSFIRRFGSAIVINDQWETLVDIIHGQYRLRYIVYLYFIVLISKLLSANVVGIVSNTIVYLLAYFYTTKDIDITFTEERVAQTIGYRHPRMTRIFGYWLLVYAIYAMLKITDPTLVNTLSLGIFYMTSTMSYLHVSPAFISYYQVKVASQSSFLIRIESTISAMIDLSLAMYFLTMRFEFKETHNTKIEEILVTTKRKKRLLDVIIMAVIALLVYLLLPTLLGLGLVVILVLISYRFIGHKGSYLNIYGHSDKPWASCFLSKDNLAKIHRAFALIFGWQLQPEATNRSYPHNIIPRESGSFYEAGMRTSFQPALRIAQRVGFVVALYCNVYVFYQLYSYAFNVLPSFLHTVLEWNFTYAWIFFGFLMSTMLLNWARVKLQQEEFLIIGHAYIARYFQPTLWILHGGRLEGTQVKRGVSRPLWHYDSTRKKFDIYWQKILAIALLLLVVLLIFAWILLGALNPGNVIYVLPFLFKSALRHVMNPGLGAIIVLGYASWIFMLWYYPRLYRITRPQLFLEMQSAKRVPIVLRNFEDHQEASLQFTSCLVNAARPKRRTTSGRPGYFVVDIELIDVVNLDGTEGKLDLYFGDVAYHPPSITITEDGIETAFTEPITLNISALAGFPKLVSKATLTANGETSGIDKEDELHTLFTNMVDLAVSDSIQVILEVTVRRRGL